ncbi:unnamed protein product [Ophioblennius macclurei]
MSSENPEQMFAAKSPGDAMILEDLQRHLSAECFKYVQSWIQEKGVDPVEIRDFLQLRDQGPALSPKSKDLEPTGSCDSAKIPRTDLKMSKMNPMNWWPKSKDPIASVSFVVTGETFKAHETILDHLRTRNVKVSKLSTVDQDPGQGTIVFCPITSRAGSDVEAAMRSPAVSGSDKKVFLVLMHHTRDVEYSTAGPRCSEGYPMVKCEIHFLFHETQPGLLKCAQNSQASDELCDAICK